MKLIKVTILMKSGRAIPTTHGWEEMKQIIAESTRIELDIFDNEKIVHDDEIVVEALMPNLNNGENTLQWVSVKQSEIEGFQNLID